jgi:hypothetical protein
MSEENEQAQGLGTGAGAAAPAGDVPAHGSGFSDLDRIRERAAKGPANKTHDLDIPGFNGELSVRYKVLPFERARAIELERASDPSDWRELRVMMDEMIEACECILVSGEDGQMVPLAGEGGRLVRFDGRLAKGFGIDAEEAREVVLGVFAFPQSVGRDRAPYMISQHFEKYLSWLNSARGSTQPGE